MESQVHRGYTIEGIGDLIRFKITCGLLLACTAPAADSLPDAPGKATVQRVCSGCHAIEVFAGKPHTRQEWSEIVDEMKNAGAKASKAEFRQIVAYLAKAFPKR
jgi:cytochrome c5